MNDKIEIVIDGNCSGAPAPRANDLNAEQAELIERLGAGDEDAWDAFDAIVVAFSGGKDSLAATLQLLELGCPREKLELWHHDIDGQSDQFMDWPVTADYCQKVADELGLPLYFSWKDGGFKGEMLRDETPTATTSFECGDGETRTAGGKGPDGTRMKWPAIQADLKVRWCSAYLKIDVAATVFRNDPRFKDGCRCLIITGERREESTSRAKYREAEVHRSTNKKREVIQWRSVIDYSESQVWDIIERWGITPHPCYRAGFARCSCAFCIFGGCDQFATAADLLPEQFEKLVVVEEALGHTMQRKSTLREHVAKGRSLAAKTDPAVRAACAADTYELETRTDDWELPAGAFRSQGGPV